MPKAVGGEQQRSPHTGPQARPAAQQPDQVGRAGDSEGDRRPLRPHGDREGEEKGSQWLRGIAGEAQVDGRVEDQEPCLRPNPPPQPDRQDQIRQQSNCPGRRQTVWNPLVVTHREHGRQPRIAGACEAVCGFLDLHPQLVPRRISGNDREGLTVPYRPGTEPFWGCPEVDVVTFGGHGDMALGPGRYVLGAGEVGTGGHDQCHQQDFDAPGTAHVDLIGRSGLSIETISPPPDHGETCRCSSPPPGRPPRACPRPRSAPLLRLLRGRDR